MSESLTHLPASASDELRASEARYRSLVLASSAIVWGTPADGQFTAPQPGWTAFTGQSFEQLRGWGWLDAVHPDDRAHTAAQWRQSLQLGTMGVVEHRLRTAAGRYRYMSARAAPVINAQGQVTEWLGIHVDIDERKRAEERLRLLDAMSQATRNAVDAKSIMEVNTRLLGEYLDVTRCPYADLEPDNDCFTIRHDWLAAGAASTVGVYSLNLFGARAAASMRAGSTLVIRDVDRELDENSGAVMFNAIACKAIICCPLVKGGKLVAMMAVHQDGPRDWSADDIALVEETAERCWAHIERVRATEALREADRRKSEFIAILAHELRNPLAPIRNGLQVMRLAADQPATVTRVRAMMERQVNQMVDLVDDLLDVARITRGDFELKRALVDLSSIVASAVDTSGPLIALHQHQFSIALPPDEVVLDVDATRITQVIANVLNNAAKYTPDGGRIALLASVSDGKVHIRISDNGVGIAPENALSVFDMFTQVGTAMERSQGGLGIGLSLARRLVQLHGGSITLVSDTSEPGSTFEICLPLPHQPIAQLAAEPAASAHSPARALRILVVDDNADAAEMLGALLELLGHSTRSAANGAEALVLAEAWRPEVAFLDIGMPGMNGYELSERLGQLPDLNLVRIALTGWGEDNDRARSKAAGFAHHLLKPCDLEVVDQLLRAIALLPSA
jgi:PAS domain S-box-containing protein